MRFTLVLLAACSDTAAVPDATVDAPARPDLLLHYPMDEAPASGTVRDATGHSDGQCTGGSCPAAVAGIRGSAFAFDGEDMVHVMSTTEIDSMRAYTISLWVRDASGPACLFGKRVGTTVGNTFQLCLGATNAVVVASWNGNENVVTTTTATLTTAWHHLALTWSGGTETLYVDGAAIGSHTVIKAWDSGPLLVGGDVDDDTPTAFFIGAIDDVRLYGRVLDAAEISALATP